MLLTKFYYAECSLLLSGNTRRVAVFQFHAYANQPWHSSLLKGHLKSRNFSLTFSLFPNERRRLVLVLTLRSRRAAMKIRKRGKFPDEQIAIPIYFHRHLILTFESSMTAKKKFYSKNVALNVIPVLFMGSNNNHYLLGKITN